MKKKTILFQILFLFSLCFSNSFSQPAWVQQPTGIRFTVNDMVFLDNNTGFAVTGSSSITGDSACVLRTTNSGQTWYTIIGPLATSIKKITYRASNGKIYLGNGQTLETSNGGVSWYMQSSPVISHIALQFFGADSAVADYQWFTTNGGLNWSAHGAPPYGGYGFDYKFLNFNTGYGVGAGYANYTTNAGMSWGECWSAAINSNLWSADVYNSRRIIFSGSSDVWWTINGGATDWNHTAWGVLFGHTLYKVKYLDSTNILTVSTTGGIFRSSNSGADWLPQASGTTKGLRNIYFLNPMTGWVMGDSGKVLKTTTGGWGPTFIQPVTETPDNFSLSQNYPNPFNPNTVISYRLSVAGNINLNIYDANGRLIKILESGFKPAGNYEISFSAEGLSSGAYYYNLSINGVLMDTKKAVVLK